MSEVKYDLENTSLFHSGSQKTRDSQVIAQDAGRTENLLYGTVMGRIVADDKWVPLTDIAATNGTATNLGFYVGADIAAADLVAGDVTGADIVVGGDPVCDYREDCVVLENSLTLDSVVGATTVFATTIRDILYRVGLYSSNTVTIGK